VLGDDFDQVIDSRSSIAVERKAVAVRGHVRPVDKYMALNVVQKCVEVRRLTARQSLQCSGKRLGFRRCRIV
jgi:hypothetical protein